MILVLLIYLWLLSYQNQGILTYSRSKLRSGVL